MIPFSPRFPAISKSQPVRAFRVGQYLALLFENPKSLAETEGVGVGIITYLYALAVITTTEPPDLVLMVTAEQSGLELRQMMSETAGVEQTTDPFLCFFDEEGGHHNLGQSPKWADQAQFVTKALDVVRERFQIRQTAVEVKAGGAPVSSIRSAAADRGQDTSTWAPRHYLLTGIAVVITAMLVYPPYRVFGYGGFQGVVVAAGTVTATGYAFIFNLPYRASIDVGQLTVQWIGVLLVGAIVYFALGKR
jgi:hypothetical protein